MLIHLAELDLLTCFCYIAPNKSLESPGIHPNPLTHWMYGNEVGETTSWHFHFLSVEWDFIRRHSHIFTVI